MDFDDLDDAIEERIAEGEVPLGAVALVPPPGPYKPKAYMPDLVPSKGYPGLGELPQKLQKELRMNEKDRKVCIRGFFFYGQGDTYADWASTIQSAPAYMELAVYEWPGRGTRVKEEMLEDWDSLVEDAFKQMKFNITMHSKDKSLEGAPFGLIGLGGGVTLMTAVAKKLKYELGLEPACVVAVDRAPPNHNFLSEHGKECLSNDPYAALACSQPVLWGRTANGTKDSEAFRRNFINLMKLDSDNSKIQHQFECDVTVIKAKGNSFIDEEAAPARGYYSRGITIEGTDNTFRFPIVDGTTVGELKAALSKTVESDITIKSGSKIQDDDDRITGDMTVTGIKSFKQPAHKYEHPFVFIGAGYQAAKTGAEYMRDGFDNMLFFDKHDCWGGSSWVQHANKHSKLQTEFGSFHCWWGPEYAQDSRCGGWPQMTWQGGRWNHHSTKPEVLDIIRHVASEYGLMSMASLSTEVTMIDINGDKDALERYYTLTVESLKGGETKEINASCIYSYPGSMRFNRRLEYPGEETFDGQIGYGMGDEYNYEKEAGMLGATVAIVGNGAFAVENVRSCVERGCKKCWLVTRRKNLPSPRVPCWFVHQAQQPTPGRLVLDMFIPMYELCGLGDPWTYWSVHSDKSKWNVTIIQASRFGIGDVTFLAHKWGMFEYAESTIKRVSRHCLHLANGQKIEDCTGLIKSLGLIGDFKIDKMHRMKMMLGRWCSGDYRRVLAIDDTGMNAANFTTFSLGIGIYGSAKQFKYLHDFPNEYYQAAAAGLLDALPQAKAEPEYDRPVYVNDVKYTMTGGMILSSYVPVMDMTQAANPDYKHMLYHKIHPTDEFLDYCQKDWDRYQKMFKEVQGIDEPYVPYPYTREVVEKFYKTYSDQMGFECNINGPGNKDDKYLFDWQDSSLKAQRETVVYKEMVRKMHKGGDPGGLVGHNEAYNRLKQFTTSNPDTGMTFDEDQIQEWSQWTAGSCTFVDLNCKSEDIRSQENLMEMITEVFNKKKAPAPSK